MHPTECFFGACAQTQSAHDAEVLCLAFSPMMVPSGGSGRGAAPPPRSPPDSGDGETGRNGVGDAKASPDAEEGAGRAVSPGTRSSSSTSFAATAAAANSARQERKSEGHAGGGVSVGDGGELRSVSAWEAVDPLDPAGAAERMLSPSSLAAPRTDGNGASGDVTTINGGSSGSRGGGGERSAGESRSAGDGGEAEDRGLVPPSAAWRGGGPESQRHQSDSCAPLVLLASASRDRLVHVFDASLSSRGARGGGRGAVAETAAATPPSASATTTASFESGGVYMRGRAGGGGGGAAGAQARDGLAGGPAGVEARASGEATTATATAEVGAAAMAAAAPGLPLVKTLDSHSGSVTAVKFTKDGKRCVLLKTREPAYLSLFFLPGKGIYPIRRSSSVETVFRFFYLRVSGGPSSSFARRRSASVGGGRCGLGRGGCLEYSYIC